MKLIRCDRCQKEIPDKSWVEVPIISIEIMRESYVRPIHIDLCEDCQKEFLSWVGIEEEIDNA